MTVLALPLLYEGVVARFAADAAAADPVVDPVPQAFGWREPAKRTGTMRIVWVPGDDESGDLGELVGARQPGRDPRPLATLLETFTVYVEASDTATPENEFAQYTAARLLLDAWIRACKLEAQTTFAISSSRWENERSTRRYGATIRVLCTVEAAVLDEPLTYVDPPVTAVHVGEMASPDDTDATADAPETITAEEES